MREVRDAKNDCRKALALKSLHYALSNREEHSESILEFLRSIATEETEFESRQRETLEIGV